MTDSRRRSRGGYPSPRQAAVLLTALAMTLALAVVGPGRTHASAAPAPKSPSPAPRTVTLITGDRITLTPATGTSGTAESIVGRPAVRANGTVPTVNVTASSTPTGTYQVAAQPEDAARFLAEGSLDRGLFDVSYLADHPSGVLPVVVQYTAPLTDAALTKKGDDLPASTVVKPLDGTNAVQVDVDLAHAGQFWAAVTEGAASAGGPAAATLRLSGGISRMWLQGHQLSAPSTATPGTSATATGVKATPATEPLYTLTETIKARAGSNCGDTYDVCPLTAAALRLDGPDAGRTYLPSGDYTCVEATSPCETVRLTFRVPAGQYSLTGKEISDFDDGEQSFESDDPQLRVANDTTEAFDLGSASHVAVATPRPNDAYNGVLESARLLPDGREFTNFTFAGYHSANYWATPTQPVTTGAFYFKTGWDLGQPLVTMSVKGSHPLDLHPIYPDTLDSNIERFSGKQTLQLVDGGTGSAADLAKIDTRGKLLLIRNAPTAEAGCLLGRDMLERASQSGAAGLLFDPTQPISVNGSCDLPVAAYWQVPIGGTDHVKLPFAELGLSEAQHVRALLNGGGKVKIAVTDNGQPSYLYDVTAIHQGVIPANLATNYGKKDLARISTVVHATTPALALEQDTSFAADEALAGSAAWYFAAPATRTLYVGPVSPELVQSRALSMKTTDDGTPVADVRNEAVYDQAGPAGTEDWNDQPGPPGVPQVPTKVLEAVPGKFAPYAVCALCRQGNDFTPWAYPSAREASLQATDPTTATLAGLDPSSVHLYQGSTELTLKPNSFGASEYTLVAGSARYRLVMDSDDTHTTWNFTSAEPAADREPAGDSCGPDVVGGSGPCQPVPAIFLRYDTGTGADDTVSAPGNHRLGISAYHQDPTAAAVTSMRVWTSVDGGKSWAPAATARRAAGEYDATYRLTKLSAAAIGTLSVKVTATDAAGNDVTQIVDSAAVIAPAHS